MQTSKRRRELLRAMFLGSAAAGLYACGSSSSSPNRGPGDSPTPDNPSPDNPEPDTPNPPPVAAATELPLQPGPLSQIGPLVESEVDSILIPEGFSVRRVARSGLPASPGFTPWHQAPDGGAVFMADDGGWVYVSNSESTPGGVGALRFDANGEVTDNYRILRNTRRNCAGGATPWQTWLSCEEVGDGQVYECDPFGDADSAVAHPALGIFNHEAAAVDMPTRSVYLTEDSGSGRLYRFTAIGNNTAINGREGLNLDAGLLEVLEIEGFENGGYQDDLNNARKLHKVSWVPVQSPDRPQAEVRDELNATGSAPGTVFKGGEGIWMQYFPEGERPSVDGSPNPLRAVVFFTCKGDNRVYALDVDNDLIEVVFDNDQLIGNDMPIDDVDNLVVSPAGDVIVAEDGDAMRLLLVIPNQPSKILLQVPGGSSELTGPAFTADGSRLYFSSQRGPVFFGIPGQGLTYELTIPEAYRS